MKTIMIHDIKFRIGEGVGLNITDDGVIELLDSYTEGYFGEIQSTQLSISDVSGGIRLFNGIDKKVLNIVRKDHIFVIEEESPHHESKFIVINVVRDNVLDVRSVTTRNNLIKFVMEQEELPEDFIDTLDALIDTLDARGFQLDCELKQLWLDHLDCNLKELIAEDANLKQDLRRTKKLIREAQQELQAFKEQHLK